MRLVMLTLLYLLPASAFAGELLYVTEGNRLRRLDIDTMGDGPLVEDILIERASEGGEGGGGAISPTGRDVNGMICAFPDASGRLLAGEDTGQPNPPAGWGIFNQDGAQVGKLTATYLTSDPEVPNNPEPFGCAFNSEGVLFTTSVGSQGFGPQNGQLIIWFPPYAGFPGPPGAYPNTNASSTNFCKLATDIGTATGIAIDADDNVYVASSSGFQILKFSPPFPAGLADCNQTDVLGSPFADFVQREVLVQGGLNPINSFTGLAMSPDQTLYAASVVSGVIEEYNLQGVLLRTLLASVPPPPPLTGTPQGIAVASNGTLYFADLDLVGVFPNLGPGPNGKVRRILFDDSAQPMLPEIVREGLTFPDGVAVLPGNLEKQEWRTYGGSPKRLFYNPNESIITHQNVGQLAERWRFHTGAIITGSPVVAFLDIPGESWHQVAYFVSWDAKVYAVRVHDGTELWSFQTEIQPGAQFPQATSAHVEEVAGRETVFIGSGEIFYALDALTGEERWRFIAGTGCVDENGDPPGLCGIDGERNQIESSAIIADDTVYFGMDINDRVGGKGGFYALDAATGFMRWYFDLDSGMTCTPTAEDEIAQYDGYHSEAELNLPAGFNSRPGCDFDRAGTGCSNVWSSPAYDAERELLYVASSNCDTGDPPLPPPPMPDFNEAVFALDLAGNPVWRWRPREIDNDDLAFGAVPSLFTIDFGGADREVVGIGNKDGTYYVLDRDGVNPLSGVACNVVDPGSGIVGCDGDAADFPYWATNVVPGGRVGGIVGTPAADEDLRRIYFSTAPGAGIANIQQPTLHALDMDTGAKVWDNSSVSDNEDASFAPASAIPGVVVFGAVQAPRLRIHESAGDSGDVLLDTKIAPFDFGSAVASSAAIVDGTLMVGFGIGTRTGDPNNISDITASFPSDLVALCVSGTEGCAACNDGRDNDGDGAIDADDQGCSGPGDVSEVPDCEDGLDNDHDGLFDYPDDPGCRNRLPSAKEDPECNDGRDNDGDDFTDLDDPECGAAWDDSEDDALLDPSCGLLGGEALLLLGLLMFLSRTRRVAMTFIIPILCFLLTPTLSTPAAAAPMPVAVNAQMKLWLANELVGSSPISAGTVSVDSELGTLQVPAGLISLLTGRFLTSSPAGVTRVNVQLANASGTFSFGGAGTGSVCSGPAACVKGGGFGGIMPITGWLGLALLNGGGDSVSLSVVGQGGRFQPATLAITGAPWTLRTAAVRTAGTRASLFTRMGDGDSPPLPNLSLVTPIRLDLGSGPETPTLPFFLEFVLVPEPKPGWLLLLAAVGGLLLRYAPPAVRGQVRPRECRSNPCRNEHPRDLRLLP